MKDIPINILKPGMVFTEPVYIDEGNFLVPPGIAIKKKDLSRLTTWGVQQVHTSGNLAKTPEMVAAAVAKQEHSRSYLEQDAIVEAAKLEFNKNYFESPPDAAEEQEHGGDHPKQNAPAANSGPNAAPGAAQEETPGEFDPREIQGNTGSYREYITLILRLDKVFSHATTKVALDTLNQLTTQLLGAIRNERSQFVGYVLGGKVNGRELAKSSINSAILAAMTAQELKLPSHKIMKIVIGAMLHDIGMLRLPKELLNKQGGLSREETKLMHLHPLYSYRIAFKELNYSDEVGHVALQHHERWDGQGYPAGISGEDIDIGARILSVADAFEAMISKKPYRNSMAGSEAMKALISGNQSRFDPDVLKAFIATMGIYPVGSIVVLNDAAIARVTEVQHSAPLRPLVQILIDKFGKKQLKGEILNLLTDKTHFISRALNPKELANKSA
ncbi:MAG: HD-GYP domain-containing protein [Treponema sp.]|jgi:HD-GYP domain-containing protein (c-di-GMP phosphodiesterase class II)|nr:HD-GYP domain-containing protein [Treponema sp.]